MSKEIVPYNGSQREPHKARGNIVLFNIGGMSEDDRSFASEIVKSCTQIAPSALFTLRYLIFWASMVAIAAITVYGLVGIMPHVVFLLSRVFVDLPLGILTALCGLLIPLLHLVFVQLPVAIGQGVVWMLSSVGYGVYWVVSSLGYGIFWVGYGVYWVVSSLGYGIFWVGYGAFWLISSLFWGVLWVISSILYFIFMCMSLPFRFLYSIALVEEL